MIKFIEVRREMSRKSELISEETERKARLALKKCSQEKLVVRKLEAIIAACKHGISCVARVYDVTDTTLRSWIRHFLEDETEHLKAPPSRRRKSILNDDDRTVISGLIKENPQLTGAILCQKVLENLGKKVSPATMYRELKKLGFSHITPRPQHHKQDKEKVEAFKKTSTKS
jgi:transposase